MSKKLLSELLLALAAMIWGLAFVAQSLGMEWVEPFTFGAVRNAIGALALLPVVLLRKRLVKAETQEDPRATWIGGLVCGAILFVATSLQQHGVAHTTVGKASFITALYIVIVPLFSLLAGRKVRSGIWLAVGMAVVGLYLLCMNGSLSISRGDLLILACVPCFALHILAVSHYAPRADGVKLSCIQFAVVALLSMPAMFLLETPTLSAIWTCKGPLLYAGVLSCGVGYTLQIVGQRDTEPSTASLLMSLESVFGALGGWIILGEGFTLRELIGAGLMFAAVLLAQRPARKVCE